MGFRVSAESRAFAFSAVVLAQFFISALVSCSVVSGTHLQGKRVLVHRESPKRVNPHGPCSTIVDLASDQLSISALRDIVGVRLGFPAGSFVLDGVEVHGDLGWLLNETLLQVFEAVVDTESDGDEGDAVITQPKQLLVHREGPKRVNPNGPCSIGVEMGLSLLNVANLQSIVEERLGFPVGRLEYGGEELQGNLDSLPDGAMISAFEVGYGEEL